MAKSKRTPQKPDDSAAQEPVGAKEPTLDKELAPAEPEQVAKVEDEPSESRSAIAKPPPPSKVVTGPAAVDPTRRAGHSAPLPISAQMYCGIAGIAASPAAGFQVWAKLNGHGKCVRSVWDQLFETYKTSKVS
jgi:hypothetical protein